VQARHYQMEIPILPFTTEQVWINTSVQFFTPVSLQLLRKQADVGSSLIKLLALLLWYVATATIDAMGIPCRSHECI